MRVATIARPAELPLAGGIEGATVRVHPLLTAHIRVPPQFLDGAGRRTEQLKSLLTRRSKYRWVPVPAFLVEHPGAGPFLIDTGMHSVVATRPRANLGRALATAFRVRMEPGQEARAQVRARGVAPEHVGVVVMTHLHHDHASATTEFPSATFIADASEWEACTRGSFRQGYRRRHVDQPFDWRTIDFDGPGVGSSVPFGRTVDLFGDGSVRLVSTPGHSPGHLSVLLRLAGRELLLTGDAAYSGRTLDESLVPLYLADHHLYDRSLRELLRYAEATPDAMIIHGHDEEQWPGLERVYG